MMKQTLLAATAAFAIHYAAPAIAATPDLSGTWSDGGGLTPVFLADGSVCMFGCAKIAAEAAAASGRPVVTLVSAPAAAPAAPRKPDRPVYKPEFAARVAELNKTQIKTDPALRCANPGVPRIGPPAKIVQSGDQVVFLYDDLNGSFWRIIPTDGRAHRTEVDPSLLGDAVGRWEGDTLVVETARFNDVSWLIDDGAFHTDQMKVTETFKKDGDALVYQVRVDDSVLAEPWIRPARKLTKASTELQEPAPCVEQDLDRIENQDEHHDNAR